MQDSHVAKFKERSFSNAKSGKLGKKQQIPSQSKMKVSTLSISFAWSVNNGAVELPAAQGNPNTP
jgi:hypothetical protein